jgi:hypothetical protein
MQATHRLKLLGMLSEMNAGGVKPNRLIDLIIEFAEIEIEIYAQANRQKPPKKTEADPAPSDRYAVHRDKASRHR